MNHGVFDVTNLNEDKSEFSPDSTASRIDCQLTLQPVDEDRRAMLGPSARPT
ncbi:hypothetical protein ACS8YF_12370 [Salinisphaera sp. SWV1]|uniref:hypothetical protein n=1 Tax=Salinisphaera sp. SWV1 TaxID=3454139 RepID=UPI003F87C301